MKYLVGYTDPFISPVTGLSAVVQPLPDLDFGYVWMGDKNNHPIESFKLIDLSIDVKSLQKQVNVVLPLGSLTQNHLWIGDASNKPKEAIAIDVPNLPVLGAALFPYPSLIPLPPIAIPNPTFNPVSGFDWLMSGPWLPQIFAGSPNAANTTAESIISSSLAMTQIKVAQAIERIDNARFIVKSKNLSFTWDNPAMALVPDSIRSLYGLNPDYTLSSAQALDELDSGILFTAGRDGGGDVRIAIPDVDYLTPTLPEGQLFLGNSNDVAVPQQNITIDNLPGLNADTLLTGEIWRGTMSGRPEISDALTVAESDIVLINSRFATAHFILNSGSLALQTLMPFSQFLSNVTSGFPLQISPISEGKIETASLQHNYLWIGDPNGKVASQPNIELINLPNLSSAKIWIGGNDNRPVEQELIALQNLPDLQNTKCWQGDVNNRPVEVSLAPIDATYILKQPIESMTNAQALSELVGAEPKILKAASTGAIEVALSGTDYPTVVSVTEAQAAADLAQATADSVALEVADIVLDNLPYNVVPLVTVGTVLSATAASVATLSLDVAAISNELTIEGDVMGNCSLRTGLGTTLTSVFSPDPVFTGGAVTLPSGPSSNRPPIPIPGMIRYISSV